MSVGLSSGACMSVGLSSGVFVHVSWTGQSPNLQPNSYKMVTAAAVGSLTLVLINAVSGYTISNTPDCGYTIGGANNCGSTPVASK